MDSKGRRGDVGAANMNKACNMCSIPLVLGDNWTEANRRSRWYICKPCKANKVREPNRKWREQNKDKVREYNLKNIYGITSKEYDEILKHQRGMCAICETTNAGNRHGTDKFCIDHDHLTGRVRGLLCNNCNHGLGKFKDDILTLQSAIEYLEEQGE